MFKRQKEWQNFQCLTFQNYKILIFWTLFKNLLKLIIMLVLDKKPPLSLLYLTHPLCKTILYKPFANLLSTNYVIKFNKYPHIFTSSGNMICLDFFFSFHMPLMLSLKLNADSKFLLITPRIIAKLWKQARLVVREP